MTTATPLTRAVLLRKVMQSVVSVRPPNGLFSLQLLNQPSSDVRFFRMCMGHDHSWPGIEDQAHKSRSRVRVRLARMEIILHQGQFVQQIYCNFSIISTKILCWLGSRVISVRTQAQVQIAAATLSGNSLRQIRYHTIRDAILTCARKPT